MGSGFLAIFSLLPVINAFAVIGAGIVVFICAFLSRVFSHVPEWMTVPPIYLSGYLVPESVIFSGGLCVVAVLLIFCQSLLFLLRRALLQRDANNKNLLMRFINITEYSFSVLSAFALITQAVVPVQENVTYTFFGLAEVTDNTKTHETAALIWWLAEAVHWILNFVVESRSSQLSFIRRFKSFTLKHVIVALAIVFGVLGRYLKPSLPASKSTVTLYFHVTNFCNWATTVCFFLAYFAQSWQAGIILDMLGIRSFFFGSLSRTKRFPTNGELVTPITPSVEQGERRHRE